MWLLNILLVASVAYGVGVEDNEACSAMQLQGTTSKKVSAGKKPHILFIIADDYGSANIGYHRRDAKTPDEKQGQAETQTPTLDGLADEGVILDRHYSYKICGPSRASLLSGRLGPHIGPVNSAVIVQNESDPVSGYMGIPRNMTAMGTKMQTGGYRTHYVGKWDAGMATPQHTPRGRGFDSAVFYYQHSNDYWTKKTPITATGEVTICLNALLDIFVENDTYRGGYTGPGLSDGCRDSMEKAPPCYEETIFEQASLDIIRNHDVSDEGHPLFLMHAFHLLHSPLQIPTYWFELINKTTVERGGREFENQNRRLYAAMTLYMDATVRNLTEALEEKGMWENTLFLFTSDNGGPIYEPGAANNYPLRGGKYNDFEGGVKTSTFLSGGFIPQERRGTIHSGIVDIADWYATFSALAGVDPGDSSAEEANPWLKEHGLPLLPPIDSIDQLGFILNGTNGRPNPLYLSATAVLDFPFKLVVGEQPYMVHTGPLYPNCSTVASFRAAHGPDFVDVKMFDQSLDMGDQRLWRGDCGQGCLFNVEDDPNENNDLSDDPQFKDKLVEIIGMLVEFNKTFFNPPRGDGKLEACYTGIKQGGFYGPWVDIDGYYTVPEKILTAKDKATMAKMAATETKLVMGVAANIFAPLATKWVEVSGDYCCEDPSTCKNGPTSGQPISDFLPLLKRR